MSSTSRAAALLGLVSAGLLAMSWAYQSFGLLCLAAAASLGLLAVLVRRTAVFVIPAVSVAVMLAVVEFALPYLTSGETTRYDPESDYVRAYFERADGLGYKLRPGVHTSRKITLDGDEVYDVVYTIGPDGYRVGPADDAARLYLYGGSFAFGEGLRDDETIPYYLWANHGIPARNLGIHGYGMHQALFMIENGISAEGGFNLLLTAPWHALRSACKSSHAIGSANYVVQGDFAIRDGICRDSGVLGRILGHSRVMRLFLTVASKNAVIEDADIERYLAIIHSFARETRARNSRLMIAYIKATDLQLRETGWTNDALIRELSGIADVLVDVTLSDRSEDLDSGFVLHPLDDHPSARANAERARLIADAMRGL